MSAFRVLRHRKRNAAENAAHELFELAGGEGDRREALRCSQ